MGRRKSFFAVVALLIVAMLTVAACGGNQPAEEPGQGNETPGEQPGEQPSEGKVPSDTFVLATSSYPSNLDPAVEYDIGNSQLVQNMYDRLFEYEVVEQNGELVGTSKVVGSLAKDWEISDDGLTYTFYLVENATFHDGSPVNAEAVVYSISRAIRMGQGPSWILSQNLTADAIEAVDEYTVKMTLQQPYSAFLATLTTDTASIVNPAVIEEHGGVVDGEINEWMAQGEAGSGPFMLDEVVQDQSITLKRYEDYWREPAQLEYAIWQLVKEPSNQELFLKNGEVDMANKVPDKDMADMAEAEGVEVYQAPAINIFYIPLNLQQEPFDDVRVRQAMNYAINKQAMIEYLKYGFARQLKGPIPEGMPGYSDEYWDYAQDLDKAKELLTEAGYPDGFSTTIVTSSSHPDWNEAATMMQADLEKLGIDMEIQTVAGTTWRELRDNGECPLTFIGWYPDYNDPDSYVHPLLGSSNFGSGGNWSWYKNERVDELIDAAKTETNLVERENIYTEIQQIAVEDAPWLFLYQEDNVIPMRTELQDFVAYPISYLLNLRLLHK